MKEYEKQTRLGCIDISSRAIQEFPPPRLVRKYLNPPTSFKDYEKRCDSVMTRIGEEIGKDYPDYSTIQTEIDEYRDNCANQFSSYKKPGFNVVAQRLGVLALRESLAIYCTASLLGPNYIKTALHCLQRPGQSGVLALKEIVFSPYTKPSRTVAITEAFYPPGINVENYLSSYPGEKKDAKNEYVVLKLAEPVQIAMSEQYQIGTVKDIDRYLVIPGFNSLIAYRGQTGSYETFKNVFSNWTDFIYWDGSGGCILDRVESDVCLIHSCQTTYGQSGAPVFGYNTDNLLVIDLGVHSGGFNEKSCRPLSYVADRPHTYSRAAANLANALNIKWVNRFNGK